jgi:hypothetical protein
MRFSKILALFGSLAVGALCAETARADDDTWMYRRSYFSHWPTDGSEPTHPLPEQRSAHRPAYYREAPGFAFRSAIRWNNFVLRNGPRTDRTLYVEGFIEFNP